MEGASGKYEIEYLQKQIDKNHLDCLWYGGRIVEVKYKGYTFILGAYGDVRATLFDRTGKNEVAFVKDKQNSGRFYEEMSRFILDDKHLRKYIEEGRLVLENNNWFEVLVDDPKGFQHDTGWTTCSDQFDEAVKEMICGMDAFINECEERGDENVLQEMQ